MTTLSQLEVGAARRVTLTIGEPVPDEVARDEVARDEVARDAATSNGDRVINKDGDRAIGAGSEPVPGTDGDRAIGTVPAIGVAALRVDPPAALAGAPVALLVPGFTGSKEDFGPILDPLAAAGFSVLAIDLPGQFESAGPDEPAAYSPDALAQVVCALAEELGAARRPILLLGHSFGGLVARAAVIAHPGLFASLVLMSSGPAALGGERGATMDRLDPVLAESGLPGVYAALEAAAAADPAYLAPPADVAAFLERRFLSGSPAMLRGMADALRAEPDRVAELAAAGVPTLVLHGVDDDAWPPGEQAAMAGRLAAQYVVVPAAAHSPAVENPAATARHLVEFWRRVESSALG